MLLLLKLCEMLDQNDIVKIYLTSYEISSKKKNSFIYPKFIQSEFKQQQQKHYTKYS